MALLTRHALRVYASLAALKTSDEDILDALIPFFDPILQLMHKKLFEPALLAAGVEKLYHWKFTTEVAEHFIPRLLRKGFLERTGTQRDALYVVNFPAPPELSGEEDIKVVFDGLIDKFEAFPPRVTDLLSYNRSRDELADTLLRFLVASNAFGEAHYDPKKNSNVELLANLEEGGRQLSESDRYMAARFVRHIADTEPEYVPQLSRLAAIGLLTEVVDDFVRPTTAADKVDLTIVLDAPLALDYLGLSGKAILQDVRNVFTELQKIGCKLVVFPITCEEMSRNLRSMLARQPGDRWGYTHQAILKREVVPDFVRTVAARPEDALENLGVKVIKMTLDSHQGIARHFTKERCEDFFSYIRWGADVRAKEHDTTCMTLLMRLREGKHFTDVFRCRYVLATRNVTFYKVSRKYCVESHLIRENQEGPVIHQRDLATMAWLRTGLGSAESIPRAVLVANCEKVLRVRPEVTAAVRNILKEFSPAKEEQFELLLQDHRSVQKMADATLNDETVVTAENADRVLELMRLATAEELHERFEIERKAANQKHRQQQQRAQHQKLTELGAKDDKVRELEEKFANADRRQRASGEKIESQIDHMIDHINKWVKVLSRIIALVLLGFMAAAILHYLLHIFPDWIAWWIITPLGLLGVIRLILGFYEKQMWGVRHLLDWVGGRLLEREISRHRVHAVPEKAQFEIRFPRVEGYRQAVRNRVTVDWKSLAPLRLDPNQIPPEVQVKGMLPTNQGRPSLHGPGALEDVTMNPYRRSHRLQRIVFEMARDLAKQYLGQPDCGVPAHVLFPQLVGIVDRYVRNFVMPVAPAERIDIAVSPYYGWVIERLVEAIRPDASAGEAPELPAIESNRPSGTTAEVDFWTSREVRPVLKSHVNYVVADTKQWEQSAAYFIDTNGAVEAFVKNAGLGFAIPYLHNGQMHDYEPDFILRLKGTPPLYVILETKGYDPVKEVKRQAAERWIAAINADGRFGPWRYVLVEKPWDVPTRLGELCATRGADLKEVPRGYGIEEEEPSCVSR